LNDDAYAIDLLKNFGTSFIFNVEDVVDYKGLDFNPGNPLVDEPFPEPIFESAPIFFHSDNLSNIADKVDKILDDEIIATKNSYSKIFGLLERKSTN